MPILGPLHRVKTIAANVTCQGYVKDPYHGPSRIMGLAFSVLEGVKIPSSLIKWVDTEKEKQAWRAQS
ncbi:hypothetical protein Nepgr_009624 [Nepenthes gracilis]|uniref:Uncharacterized protein n=1 Tax=Nepenthes gracilis TaxID=150966 RepID=A0AAD3XKI5_NEPGR|nr:hypothetical protein Nepgr_009624 [Nepenthes gracilis]